MDMRSNHHEESPLNKWPIWKTFLVMNLALIGVSLPVLLFMTVIGHVNFFTSLMYVTIGVVVFTLVFLPLAFLWEKLNENAQERLRNWAVGALLVSFLFLYPLGMFGGQTWGGEGAVNLFPDSDSSKNYRLDADIVVQTQWWWNREYTIETVYWPDGGNTDFPSCVITKDSNNCTDEEGREWSAEVVDAPADESDSSEY